MSGRRTGPVGYGVILYMVKPAAAGETKLILECGGVTMTWPWYRVIEVPTVHVQPRLCICIYAAHEAQDRAAIA